MGRDNFGPAIMAGPGQFWSLDHYVSCDFLGPAVDCGPLVITVTVIVLVPRSILVMRSLWSPRLSWLVIDFGSTINLFTAVNLGPAIHFEVAYILSATFWGRHNKVFPLPDLCLLLTLQLFLPLFEPATCAVLELLPGLNFCFWTCTNLQYSMNFFCSFSISFLFFFLFQKKGDKAKDNKTVPDLWEILKK